MSTQMQAQIKAASKPVFTPAPTRLLQPRVVRQTEPAGIPSKVHEVINSPGQPLDPATRNVMESRLGHNFSQVRVHNDAQAASSAQDLSAAAYTSGYHIGFAARHYAPETHQGQRLLAHELTHVVQHMRSGTPSAGITPADHTSEREAERIAMGESFTPTAQPGGRLQRQLLAGMQELAREEAQAEINLVQGFLDGAKDTIETNKFITIYNQLNPFTQPGNAAKYAAGAIVGIPWGALLELGESIASLAELIAKATIYAIPGGALALELYEYAKDSKGYEEEQRRKAEMWHKLRTGLEDFVVNVLKDRTYLEKLAAEVGPVLGRLAGKWVNEKLDEFIGMSPFKKGLTIGEIEGRIIFEIALLFVGPEEIAVRVAPKLAKLGEAISETSRLGKFIIEMMKKVPALKDLLEARKLAEAGGEAANLAGKVEKGVATASKGVEDVAAGANEAEKALAGKAPHVEPHAEPPAPRPKQEPAPAPTTKQEPTSAAKPATEGQAVQSRNLTVDPEIDADVERSFIESAEGGPAASRRPQRPSSTGRAKDARAEFNNLRDGYAQRLGVGQGGQVHHAIELQVLDRYPGAYTEAELNAFTNMRGIPGEDLSRRQLHNSKIREIMDRHYSALDDEIARLGLKPGTQDYNNLVRRYLTDARDETDYVLGQFFSEYRSGLPRSFQ